MNLRELHMETVQLDQHAKEMESRLEELKQRMNQEKEEREKMGASHWRSAQALAPAFQRVKTNKENAPHRLSPGKMKIRVLKDESVPEVQKQVKTEPSSKAHGTDRKLKLRGKVCGQCEVQLAGLMCSECGEDYCVGCFVRFHQKGALKRHRMVPVQAELQTPVSTRDVLGRLQQQVSSEESQLARGASSKSTDEIEAVEERSAPRSLQPMSDNQIHHTQVLFVNDGVDLEDEEADEEEDSSLLGGCFDEEQSARSFQEALKEWRDRGQRPVSVMETQTERGSHESIHVEFKEDTLSYMEKLLLKKHRRGQIEEFHPRSVVQPKPEPTTPSPEETDELSRQLAAERKELHKYLNSLFASGLAEDAGKVDSPAESCLSIVELDEMVGDAETYRSFGVKQGNTSKMFAVAENEDFSGGGEFGHSVLTSTPSLSVMTKGLFQESNSDINIKSSHEIWLPSQETEKFTSSLPRSESYSPLQMSLQRSQHFSTTSEQFLSNSRKGGQKVELSDSPKPSPQTRFSKAQQGKSLELQPTKNKLNRTLPDFEDHISSVSPSPASLPSARSSQSHSPAFLLIPKQNPKPPDSPSPRSRPVSSPVHPIQSRSAHSTPDAETNLAQLSPESAITSSRSAVPSLRQLPRESVKFSLVSDRGTPTMHVSIRSSTPGVESSHTEGHNSPQPSKWLKGSRRTPKATVLSLQLNMSDSEEEMTCEDCLVPSEEDSSDEELKRITDLEEQKDDVSSPCPTTTPPTDPHFTFPSLLKSEHDNTEPFLVTGFSQALHSISQRQHIHSGQYQDLEGFLTLGLYPGVLQHSPAPAQIAREEQDHTDSSLIAGQESWRSSSSLQHHADKVLVTALVNSAPVSSTPRSFTPRHGRMSSQRLCFSGTIHRCSPISFRPPSIESRRPDSSNFPLSRAAQEIRDVQTVEQLDLQDSDEDEENCLALECLEEEFRNMSTTPLDQGDSLT
ncbi:zinc finger B-box domain-containing protein 1 isoform X2 [Pseudorasbora parva]|uniref:zinc finger B-box domain-containing protein 1 isoform X2 n=1 Tax=Pseudorasbora parva TaxID=51549 RepID=UPI00351E0B90